jgi:hypothetical protein
MEEPAPKYQPNKLILYAHHVTLPITIILPCISFFTNDSRFLLANVVSAATQLVLWLWMEKQREAWERRNAPDLRVEVGLVFTVHPAVYVAEEVGEEKLKVVRLYD